MNNGKPSPSLAVAVLEKTAFIKIPGRANFTSSIEFKTIVGELRQRGFERFILDLRECVTMDSTFLGVLAGLALRNADGQECTSDGEKLQLSLLNPNERIADLLENLGVVHLFAVMNEEVPCTVLFEPAKGDQRPPTREEISRTCLEAHELLMSINPENVPKFKDVARFLAEDLRQMKKEGGGQEEG